MEPLSLFSLADLPGFLGELNEKPKEWYHDLISFASFISPFVSNAYQGHRVRHRGEQKMCSPCLCGAFWVKGETERRLVKLIISDGDYPRLTGKEGVTELGPSGRATEGRHLSHGLIESEPAMGRIRVRTWKSNMCKKVLR